MLSLLSFSTMTASLPFIRSPSCLPSHFPCTDLSFLAPGRSSSASLSLLSFFRTWGRHAASDSPANASYTWLPEPTSGAFPLDKTVSGLPHWLPFFRKGLLSLPSRWFKRNGACSAPLLLPRRRREDDARERFERAGWEGRRC